VATEKGQFRPPKIIYESSIGLRAPITNGVICLIYSIAMGKKNNELGSFRSTSRNCRSGGSCNNATLPSDSSSAL
jgi:hypothetical protein